MYGLIIRLTAKFNNKARLWVQGRKRLFEDLELAISEKKSGKRAWFHCASLGEFEQGRPLMDAFRLEHPDYLIILTFFSPSGYENRKNYKGADIISYIPLDTRDNASRFLEIIRPDVVFFVKYEFWFNLLDIIQQKNIPHYLVSAIFRADQHFFKWYGDWPRSVLKGFTHIFVQNEYSAELLEFVGITNVSISGDTRFDRVVEIAAQASQFPLIEAFSKGETVLVAGSTWPADEEILIKYLNENPGKIKMILAPHEVHESGIESIISKSVAVATRYSIFTEDQAGNTSLLIIDSIGMLSQLYRYGKIAYIGGGFGAGIHNILEAAVYGMPVFFGPNYGKFHEAIELIGSEGGIAVHSYTDFEKKLNHFLEDSSKLAKASAASKDFVYSRIGATSVILQLIRSKSK
jgi:3-deoxy-D-manno-octulosonic-acid transferase